MEHPATRLSDAEDQLTMLGTSVVFNESEVLRAFDPAAACLTNFSTGTVELWYNDEHALTLGVRQLTVIASVVSPGVGFTEETRGPPDAVPPFG